MKRLIDSPYPELPDVVAVLHAQAAQVGGALEMPRLSLKYAWMEPKFGWKVAKSAQIVLPQVKASMVRSSDKAMDSLETRQAFCSHSVSPVSLSSEDSEWRG